MADRSKCDLPYGQYGRIEYLPDEKTLFFGRHIELPTVASLLDGPKVIEDPPHAHHIVKRPGDGEPKGKRHAKQIKALVEACPEFEPAADLLPHLIDVSEAAEYAQSHHDPLAGEIVAFASIRSQVRHRSVPVMATRTGTTGCTLRVAQLEMQRRGWAEDKNTWLEVPVIGGDQTIWSSSAGAIHQLVFAEETDRKDSLLAVRLTSKIIVFRVFIGKGSAKAGTSAGLMLETVFETLDKLPLGRSYTDVAFNPWFSQQIAVIDSVGGWQVLEASSRNTRQSSLICEGTSKARDESAVISDGWARIAWISDMTTIVTCTRQRCAVYSIRDAEPSVVREVPVQLAGAVPWVLGLMRMPSDLQRLIILTSTHLLLYSISRTESEGVHATPELKIHHHQNTQDLSLRVTLYGNAKGTHLGIYSNSHNTLIMHRLFRSPTGRIASGDPYHFAVPSSVTRTSSAEPIRDLFVRPLRLCRKHDTKASLDTKQSPDDVQYHTLTVIRSNGIVEESLWYIHTGSESHLVQIPVAPSWSSKPALRPTKLSFMDVMVDDSALQQGGSQEQRAEPIAARARQRRRGKLTQQDFLDLEALADALNQSTYTDQTVEDVVTKIKSLGSQNAPDSQIPTQTLDRLFDSELIMDEVERASTDLEDLFSSLARIRQTDISDSASGPRLDIVKLPASTNLSHDCEVATLSTAYEWVVSRYISTLPSQVAGRIRLAKRARACRVAFQLVLASRMLRPAVELESRGPRLLEKESHDPVETWDLPVRATRTGLQSLPPSSSIPRTSTQPSSLPTPSLTATPSNTTASSRMSTAAPQLDRLAAFTSFSKPTPFVLPRSLSNVLSHWEVGSDPNEYDWMSKSRHISQVDDDETQGLTEKERQRAQRQAERHLRRQRKEAAASQASQMASSQAVEIISTSQHSLPETGSQRMTVSKSSQPESQSQSQGRDAIASQVVRGPHGGRPPRKRRKEGF